ncbi:hypothetical protein CcCBS67573_g00914 [Chytriomyces confervae]|uniref:Uncharacterized protein n=1 Tax=Chytriomyces confervae TaxID=246404 RepID=A0A507FMY3_9FUNG|nr:hypothetical protein HDU80_003612 [Chytriomyces hyalinus]TPX77769.1 hypothetical protein CcCBS67573_g00914 [Chytriomyces confervae]
MSFLKSLFGTSPVVAEAAAAATMPHVSHRVPLIRFVGPRTDAYWKAVHAHAAAPPGTVPFSQGKVPAPSSQTSQTHAQTQSRVAAQPQTVLPPSSSQSIVSAPVTTKGPAAPSTILMYPQIDQIPRSYRAKAMSQREMDMVDVSILFQIVRHRPLLVLPRLRMSISAGEILLEVGKVDA